MDREQIETGYDKVAEDYATTFFDEFTRKPFDRDLLERFLEEHGKGRTLDVGCGPGHLARFLADRGAQAQGLDLSAEMVRVAERLNPDLTFTVGDMSALPFEDAYFTGLAAFYSLIHIPRDQVDQVIKEFWRVLMPGGGVLIAVHGGEGEIRSEDFLGHQVEIEATLFSLEELGSALRAEGFAIRELVQREPYDFEHQTARLYAWGMK